LHFKAPVCPSAAVASHCAAPSLQKKFKVKSYLSSVCQNDKEQGINGTTGANRLPKATKGYRLACIAMIGAGAAVGSLMGGNTNAARKLDPSNITSVSSAGHNAVPINATPVIAAASLGAMNKPPANAGAADAGNLVNESTYVERNVGPTAAAVIAMRFPPRWYTVASAKRPSPNPTQALAYAPEPGPAAAPVETTSARSGYQLASIDPAPPTSRKRVTRRAPPKPPMLFNEAQLASIKKRLRLTPDQEQYWPPVAAALRAIGWRHARQSNSRKPARGNRLLAIDPNSPEVERLKSAAFPLIMSLTEDQKREVRELAHTMGLSKVAAQF
jgi:hypothetical protein